MMMELTQAKMMTQEGKNLHIVKEMLQAAVEDFCCAGVMRKNLQQVNETRLAMEAAWARYNEANLDYSVEGPREMDYAIQEEVMLKNKYAKMLEDVLEYIKCGEAPLEVEVANSKVEEQTNFKELIVAKPEQILPETLEEQRTCEYAFPEAVLDNKVKVVMAENNEDLLVHVLKQEPQEVCIGGSGELDPGEVVALKDLKVEENCTENPSMEGVCSSLTKELLAEGKQDLMVHLVKQELPEVLIRSNGGLDPGEVVDFKDMVEVVAILGTEEEKQRMLMEVRSCGGLDPGEAVNKVVMEECSFKDKVEKCGFNDKVKQEMNVEVKQDAQVWKLLCDVFFNLKFEFLVAWLVLMLHTTMRLRFVNICKTAFNLESLLRLSDYG